MGKIWSITPDVKQIVTDAFDDILILGSEGGFAKTCLLVYPEKYVNCSNCVPDPFGGKSSSKYRTGGPMPFTAMQPCPMCNGTSKKASQVTEEITLKCNWEPKSFFKPIKTVDVSLPNSLVETKGFLTDLPKILKADSLVVNLPFAPYIKQSFKLKGEPSDPGNIIQGRYFVAVWERVLG